MTATVTPTPTMTPTVTPTPTLFPPAAEDETLILVADILIEPCIDDPACPKDPNNVAAWLVKNMCDKLVGHPNICIELLAQYIYEEGGSELAMAVGQRPEYQATFVMWGNYVLAPKAEIYIFNILIRLFFFFVKWEESQVKQQPLTISVAFILR